MRCVTVVGEISKAGSIPWVSDTMIFKMIMMVNRKIIITPVYR